MVTRYSVDTARIGPGEHAAEIREDEDGEFVRFEDYERLREELARATGAVLVAGDVVEARRQLFSCTYKVEPGARGIVVAMSGHEVCVRWGTQETFFGWHAVSDLARGAQ